MNSKKTDKSILVLRKIIREELKGILRPLVEEIVSANVNKILAETILPKILGEVVSATANNKTLSSALGESVADRPKIKAVPKVNSNRNDVLKKLGVAENPSLGLLYEDIDDATMRGVSSGPITVNGQTVFQDDNDAGIDEDFIAAMMERR